MTDTKTRQAVRPLLALLLTGMTLLMMGTARPVQAAVAKIDQFELIVAGGITGDDIISLSAHGEWDTPGLINDYHIYLEVTYYNASGPMAFSPPQHDVYPGSGGGTSPTYFTAQPHYPGGEYLWDPARRPIGSTGMTWRYHVVYKIRNSNATFGQDEAYTAYESYGAFADTAPPGDAHPIGE